MEHLAAREQHGRYYTFAVTVDGVTRETGDPYARAAGVNGVRSMIVDLARTAPSGWERDVRPNIPPAQRAVWEVSVRDFSQDAASGVRPACGQPHASQIHTPARPQVTAQSAPAASRTW